MWQWIRNNPATIIISVILFASGADKACETLAVGCDGPDVAASTMGPGVKMNTAKI